MNKIKVIIISCLLAAITVLLSTSIGLFIGYLIEMFILYNFDDNYNRILYSTIFILLTGIAFALHNVIPPAPNGIEIPRDYKKLYILYYNKGT